MNVIFYFFFKNISQQVKIKKNSLAAYIDIAVYLKYIIIFIFNIFGAMQFVYGFYYDKTIGLGGHSLSVVSAVSLSFIAFIFYKRDSIKSDAIVNPPSDTSE